MDTSTAADSGADRAIRWEGCHNTRDLGGLPAVCGTSTRYGRLIRSADMRFITAARPAEIQTMLIPLDDIEDLDLWRRLSEEELDGSPMYYRPFLDADIEALRTRLH